MAVHYLDGDVHIWEWGVLAKIGYDVLSWVKFLVEFNVKFFLQEAMDHLEMRFLELVKGDRYVSEYDAEFSRLLVYAGRGMASEDAQVKRFMRGLRVDLRTRCRMSRFTSRAESVEATTLI